MSPFSQEALDRLGVTRLDWILVAVGVACVCVSAVGLVIGSVALYVAATIAFGAIWVILAIRRVTALVHGGRGRDRGQREG